MPELVHWSIWARNSIRVIREIVEYWTVFRTFERGDVWNSNFCVFNASNVPLFGIVRYWGFLISLVLLLYILTLLYTPRSSVMLNIKPAEHANTRHPTGLIRATNIAAKSFVFTAANEITNFSLEWIRRALSIFCLCRSYDEIAKSMSRSSLFSGNCDDPHEVKLRFRCVAITFTIMRCRFFTLRMASISLWYHV